MNGDETRASEQDSADDHVGQALRLDGNFSAAILSEVFIPDMTTTRGMCASCGAVRPLGALPVYGRDMGVVMRCPSCDAVILRVTRTPGQLWLDLTGSRVLLVADATPPSIARADAS
jgi:hypothetical protein